MKDEWARSFQRFRPISLLSTVSKLYEGIVRARLQRVSDRHSWLPDYQVGFRPGRNSTEHLIRLQQSSHTAFRQKQVLLAAFLDIEQAYDSVSRDLLLRLLQNLGVSGNMLSYLELFLSDRSSTVRYRNSVSSSRRFTNGVPQGSPLSPLLFNIYSASALRYSGPDVAAAADDMLVWASGPSVQAAQHLLSSRLEPVWEWGRLYHQSFHYGKCKVLTISRKRFLQEPQVKFGDRFLTSAPEARYLGVIFDKTLSWKPQTTQLVLEGEKRYQRICQIAHGSRGARARVIKTIYQFDTRSKLDYGSEVWGDLSKSNSDRVESIQHKSLSRVLGVSYVSHRTDVCVETDHPPLVVRRKIQLLRYWIRLRSSPSTLGQQLQALPPSRRLRGSQRQSYFERLTKTATSLNLTLEQVLPLSDSELADIHWIRHHESERNRLDSSDPLARHRHYESFQPGVPSTHPAFGSRLPRASLAIFHSLRLGTAPLNAFLHHIRCARSPACECGYHAETVQHYLLHCRNFAAQRAVLRRDIHSLVPRTPLSLQLLLGNPFGLRPRQLLRVVRCVCKFVATSARFRRKRRSRRRGGSR